jgi:hypothetical protein
MFLFCIAIANFAHRDSAAELVAAEPVLPRQALTTLAHPRFRHFA